MKEAVFHQMMMLRPMQAGISGYARLQGEADRQLVQIHLRGLRGGSIRAFWYAGDGLARELGSSPANQKGEAGLYTELAADAVAPRRLAALLITDGGEKPRPLAIGLCTAQSAGSLMDARNALLALCDRLGREGSKQTRTQQPDSEPTGTNDCAPEKPARQRKDSEAARKPSERKEGDPHSHAGKEEQRIGRLRQADKASSAGAEDGSAEGKPCAAIRYSSPASGTVRQHDRPGMGRMGTGNAGEMPREVFLPAIDVQRERRRSRREEESATAVPTDGLPAEKAIAAKAKPAGTPAIRAGTPDTGAAPPLSRTQRKRLAQAADRLPPLHWPEPFTQVAEYFDRLLPVGLPGWPGWRFVEVRPGAAGLWIGMQHKQDRVERIAYVLPENAPVPPGRPFRRIRTADGGVLQVLVMKA